MLSLKHTHTPAGTHAHKHAHMHLHTLLHIHTSQQIFPRALTHTHTNTHTNTHTLTHILSYTLVQANWHFLMWEHVLMSDCSLSLSSSSSVSLCLFLIHTHTYTLAHTYTHTQQGAILCLFPSLSFSFPFSFAVSSSFSFSTFLSCSLSLSYSLSLTHTYTYHTLTHRHMQQRDSPRRVSIPKRSVTSLTWLVRHDSLDVRDMTHSDVFRFKQGPWRDWLDDMWDMTHFISETRLTSCARHDSQWRVSIPTRSVTWLTWYVRHDSLDKWDMTHFISEKRPTRVTLLTAMCFDCDTVHDVTALTSETWLTSALIGLFCKRAP